MSDRGAQEIFGEFFSMLCKASMPEPVRADMAKRMWKLSEKFDTSPGDWECDKELIALGLAKRGVSKDYPEDGEITLYKGLDYR